MAVATVDLKRGEVVGTPQIVTRGWAYDHDTEALLDEAREQVTKALEQALAAGSNDHENLNRVARKALGTPGRGPDPPAPDDRAGHRHRLKVPVLGPGGPPAGPGSGCPGRHRVRRCGTTLLPTVTTATKRPAGRSGSSRPKGRPASTGPVAPPNLGRHQARGGPPGQGCGGLPPGSAPTSAPVLMASMGAVIAAHATDLWGVVLVTLGVLAGPGLLRRLPRDRPATTPDWASATCSAGAGSWSRRWPSAVGLLPGHRPAGRGRGPRRTRSRPGRSSGPP